MRAAVLEGDRKLVVKDVPDPAPPGPGQVLVAPTWVGICGSDIHVWEGAFGARISHPLIPAHEFGGVIRALGEGVAGLAVGQAVAVDPISSCGGCAACLDGRHSACRSLKLLGIDQAGGLAQLVLARAHQVFPLPAGMDPADAPLAELYSVACHAQRRAVVEPGDLVVILGAGKLGLALLDVFARAGAGRVVSVDVSPDRLAVARALGADPALNAKEADPVAAVRELSAGRGADLVIEAIGHADEVPGRDNPHAQAAALVRHAGRILVMGQGGDAPGLPWRDLVWKEANIITSRVSLGEFPRAIALLAAGKLHPDKLVTHRIGLEEAPAYYPRLQAREPGMLKVLVSL